MDRFRFYYDFAQKIINEEEVAPPTEETVDQPPQEVPEESPPAEIPTQATDMSPTDNVTPSEGNAEGSKESKDIKDKLDDKSIIKKVNEKSLIILEEQIDILSIKIIERKEKINTLIESLSFLDNIDDTKPKKYLNEEKFKKLNGFLTSTEYDNLSVSNLFSIHNSLKENFKIVQKEFKDKKENNKIKELKNIAKKAKRARFSKNIKFLNKRIEKIKNNLNNINQVFNLKDFPKMSINAKNEIKLAQKNATDFLKKLS